MATNPKRLFDEQLDKAAWFSESSDVRAWFTPELATTTTASTAYTLTGLAGSYSLTGGTASLKVNRKITANAGTYALTGGTAVLKAGRSLTANAGSYSLTGGSATLTKSAGAVAYTLTGLAGSYALTGSSAALKVGKSISGLAGSYQLTGGSATLSKTTGPQALTLTGLAGNYSLIGGDAVLSWSGEAKGGGGYDDNKPKKKRFVVEINGRLVEYGSAADAAKAISQSADNKPEPQAKAVKAKTKPAAPLFSVNLADVQALAKERAALDQYKAQLAQMQYEVLLRQYEAWRDEQDIEDLLSIL